MFVIYLNFIQYVLDKSGQFKIERTIPESGCINIGRLSLLVDGSIVNARAVQRIYCIYNVRDKHVDETRNAYQERVNK